MRIGTQEFNVKEKTYIMGILNVTPDSFSDGGKYLWIDAALRRAEEMKEEGAAIIDVGGESTRPGYTPVSVEEEIERVLPVVEAIKSRIDVPISVDTYKSAVAEAAINAGADLINDIWGLKADSHMADVIAKHKVACCLMHNRNNVNYDDFIEDMLTDMAYSIDLAKGANIAVDQIILDPGIGFAKSYEQNLLAMRHIGQLHQFGFPILLGTSRKSVIGQTLNLPSDQRLEGTLATTAIAVANGCGFVRVHDIKENYRVIQMADAIYKR